MTRRGRRLIESSAHRTARFSVAIGACAVSRKLSRSKRIGHASASHARQFGKAPLGADCRYEVPVFELPQWIVQRGARSRAVFRSCLAFTAIATLLRLPAFKETNIKTNIKDTDISYLSVCLLRVYSYPPSERGDEARKLLTKDSPPRWVVSEAPQIERPGAKGITEAIYSGSNRTRRNLFADSSAAQPKVITP